MSVISNLVAMPNRIAIACEYLHYLGEKGDAWESIESQLSPLKKAGSDEDDDKPTGKSIAEDVLREIEKLGLLLRNEDSTISLAHEIRNIAPVDGNWQQALRPVLFKKMLYPTVADLCGQSDVPDAISWLLVQDPFDPMLRKGGGHVERIVSQLGESDPLRTAIGNNSRYQNLLYWARYFGYAEWIGIKSGNIVVPDPSEAITCCLPSVFGAELELSIQNFVQRLGEACTVLEEGTSRRNLETRLAERYLRKERHLSRSTSLALKRLHLRGVVALKATSDAQTWVLDLANETQPVSHVRFNAEVAK
jgi:hypothetical protein